MTDVHQCSKVDFIFLLPEWHLSCSLPYPVAMLTSSRASSIHCGFCIRNFPRLRHKNEYMHQVEVIYWIKPFFSDVILMISWKEYVPHASLWTPDLPQYTHTWFSCESWCSHSLQFPVASLRGFLVSILQGIAASFGASNFYLAFLIVSWSSPSSASIKKDASQFSSVVELWLFQSPWRANPNLRPQIIKSGGCLDVCNSLPDHIIPGGGFSFSNVNFVYTVHESD